MGTTLVELLKVLVEVLKPLGFLAGLGLATLLLWRGITTMNRLGKSLEGVEKRFLDLWFAAEQIGSTRPRLIPELVGYETWDTSMVRGLIKSARESIVILQTWFPEMEGDLDRWEFSNPEDLKIQIFMAHSENPAILERVRFRRDFPYQEPDESLKSLVDKNVNACARRLRYLFQEYKQQNKKFSGSVSLYKQGMPFGPVYIIDGMVLFGIFPPHINCNAAPMMRLSVNGKSGELFDDAIRTIKAAAEVIYCTDDDSPSERSHTLRASNSGDHILNTPPDDATKIA